MYSSWWAVCLGLACLGLATSQEVFLYSLHSCQDLMPRHPLAIDMEDAKKKSTNHVNKKKKPEEDASENATTTTTTTTTARPPPPDPTEYRGPVEVKVMPSEDSYRRLKSIEVTLMSKDYFNGFMVQARQVGSGKVVGRFLRIPHRAKFLSCPNATSPENTVMHQDAPLRLANLTFVWMAPEGNQGDIEFVASILLDGGDKYKVFKSAPLSLNKYPVSTKDCAVAKSCFRFCMDEGDECEAHDSRYMAVLEFAAQKSTVQVTIGGQLPAEDGYLALGFSREGRDMANADISVCYRDDNRVGVEHYLLASLDYMPDLHLAELQLDSSDVDGDYVWCSFTRPLKGDGITKLDLSQPTYYFYFWGMRNGTNIYLPTAQRIKRSERKISLEDEPFNEIMYSSAPARRHMPVYTIAAASILILSFHYLW